MLPNAEFVVQSSTVHARLVAKVLGRKEQCAVDPFERGELASVVRGEHGESMQLSTLAGRSLAGSNRGSC